MNKSKYVDVFYGNGEIDLPKPEGIAATWLFGKAQCGNTHPNACLPFGKLSCGLYTGGYVTGRGNHQPNSCGPVQKFGARVKGFSHMHQSGTGGIGNYYNYAVTSPMYGKLREISEEIDCEEAVPGYYCAVLSNGIKGEFTVEASVAIHRYTLSDKGIISIDFSNDGLDRSFDEKFYGKAMNGTVKTEGNNCISAEVTLHGVKTYFYVICKGDVNNAFLWDDYKVLSEKTLKRSDTFLRWGGAFEVLGNCEINVAVSHKSINHAKISAENASDFNTARKKAEKLWDEYLGKIEIDADETQKKLFYSNLYHSIIKPSEFEDGEYTDFSTLWDMYKTQLPLIYTLFAKESKGIAKTLLNASKKYEKVPNALTLTDNIHRFDGQARMLAVYTLADEYYRGFITTEELIEVAKREIGEDVESEINLLEKEGRFSRIIDITEACHTVAKIAQQVGELSVAKRFFAIADRWVEAFDEATGLLKEGNSYYEGNNWNYSFRLQADMESRIALCGSNEKFVEMADAFFGYGKEPIKQSDRPDDEEYIRNLCLNRFDGANNEHDIETPYVYLYADRHDRTCQVLSMIMKYMFCLGRGGLPGNNDTGALSSWYVWNALGLFPVSGQDKILLGSPTVKSADIKLSNGNTMKICVHGEGIYLNKAVMNGREVTQKQISVCEFMDGGILEFFMQL